MAELWAKIIRPSSTRSIKISRSNLIEGFSKNNNRPTSCSYCPQPMALWCSVIRNFPGSVAGGPKLLEYLFLLQGVHAGPETGVAVSHELPVFGEPLDRAQLP